MRRVRRKGGHKEKVFGCDLLEHLAASCQEIPQVLRSCSEFVEEHGIVDGIYRLSGVSSNTQKLRSEFDSEGPPDLNKDVYLQDIHCVSSLCKAYFRELPNPLLTYQLYDKFAEAVAIQLEEERLVKIGNVLKELSPLHYRTLEFLMRHLVKMASFSSETNMHSRNLAIVWAPNLLRSKDIEVSGFNGTAAFMEVRVQSIVVEFILTHVPQLFAEQDLHDERRKSLPSPSGTSNQEDPFFRAFPIQAHSNFGNISPGDGPLAMRPYHAIIEGTDKRKGSLKGRKWMSIFNIGGRFHDPRRKNKHASKEKERPALRPAKSMDSLSSPSYPNEGSRHPTQRPPSTNLSPLVTSSPQMGTEAGAMGGSGYAVTYRRGTGVLSGVGGTQGTYSLLDPEGGGATGNEGLQTPSRSPGLSTKVGRRAGMHIARPHLVTVPLHIAANLAHGVLQGGGEDCIIHYVRNREGWDRGESKEGRERVEQKDGREKEREQGGRTIKVEDMKEDKSNGGKMKEEEEREEKGQIGADVRGVEEMAAGVNKEKRGEEEAVREHSLSNPVQEMGGQDRGGEQGAENLNSAKEEEKDEDADDTDEYIDMNGALQVTEAVPDSPLSDTDVCGVDNVSDVSDFLNSSELDGDDQELSGYIQDNFDFLDHMDFSLSNQVNEFSVEPPCHEDNEYEVMEEHTPPHPPQDPPELQPPPNPETHTLPGPVFDTQIQTLTRTHRPLTTDKHGRPTKSLSLPYMAPPFLPVHPSSEEEVDDEDTDDSSDEDESMFYKSLPSSYMFHNLTWSGPFNDEGDVSSPSSLTSPQLDSIAVDRYHYGQSDSSEAREPLPLDTEFLVCDNEPSIGIEEQGEATCEEGLEKKEEKKEEVKEEEREEADTNMITQSTVTEDVHHLIDAGIKEETGSPGDTEKPLTLGPSANGALEFPLPRTADSGEVGTDEKEAFENDPCERESSGGSRGDTRDETDSHVTITPPSSHTGPLAAEEEIGSVSAEVSSEVAGGPVELPQVYVTSDREGDEGEGEGEEKKVEEEIEGRNGEGKEGEEIRPLIEITVGKEVRDLIIETEESDENQREKQIDGGGEGTTNEEREEQAQEAGEGQDGAVCEMSCEIWEEVEEVICEIIEYEESKNAEKKDVRKEVVTEGVAEERDVMGDVVKLRKEEEEMGGGNKEVEKEGALSEDMKVPEEGIREEEEEELMIRTEVKTVVVVEELKTPLNKEKDREMQRDSEIKDVYLAKEGELDGVDEKGDTEILEKNATKEVEKMADHLQDREEKGSKEQKIEDGEERAKEQPRALPSTDEKEEKLKESDIELREGKCEGRNGRQRSETGVEERNGRQRSETGVEGRNDRQRSETGVEERNGRQRSETGVEERNDRQRSETGVEERNDRQRSETGVEKRNDRQRSETGVEERNGRQRSETGVEGRNDRQRSETGVEERNGRQRSETGVGSVLVISKQAPAKAYQAKAVPVVPPKPQHCRLTALSLRQQQQQQGREWKDADREKENLVKVATERDKNNEKEVEDKVCVGGQGTRGEGEDESRGKKERQVLKGGEWERRRDGDEGGMRDMKRNSPISMCFDEAVAMATLKRGREKENSERERQRERGFEVQ